MATDGSANSAVATVHLTVHGVNATPVAVADSYSVDEDGHLAVDASGVLGKTVGGEGPPNMGSFQG